MFAVDCYKTGKYSVKNVSVWLIICWESEVEDDTRLYINIHIYQITKASFIVYNFTKIILN